MPWNHPALVHRERHRLLVVGGEVDTQDRTHPGRLRRALELDRTVHAVGIGAGQRAEPALGRGGGESLGARDAEAEGEVGMEMKMNHGTPHFGFCSDPSRI